MQPGEVETLTTIEKAALPKIDVAESKEGTEREVLAQGFEPPPPTDMSALNLTGIKMAGSGDPRFPIRVAVMLFHEDIDGRKGVVIHQRIQSSGIPLDDDVFVDFVVATVGIDTGDLFVATQSVTK